MAEHAQVLIQLPDDGATRSQRRRRVAELFSAQSEGLAPGGVPNRPTSLADLAPREAPQAVPLVSEQAVARAAFLGLRLVDDQSDDPLARWFVAPGGTSAKAVQAVAERARSLTEQGALTAWSWAWPAGPLAEPPDLTGSPLADALLTEASAPPDWHVQGIVGVGEAGRPGLGLGAERTLGADGADVRIAIVEQGWWRREDGTVDHPDLPMLWPDGPDRPGDVARHHGVFTLGVLVATPTTFGVHGLVPGATVVRLQSEWPTETDLDGAAQLAHRARAVTWAAEALEDGDVLLFEAQTLVGDPTTGSLEHTFNLPAEVHPAVFEAVKKAAQRVVVVACAGNSLVRSDVLASRGDLVDLEQHDSGSILVGAAHPVQRDPYSSFHGPRVTCFGYGKGVLTTSTDGAWHGTYGDFGGTSASGAMIAGAAVALQGIARASTGQSLPAADVRTMLSDPECGSPSLKLGFFDEPSTTEIGVMPDVGAVVAKYLM